MASIAGRASASISLLLPLVLLSALPAASAAPNACRRESERRITVDMRRATNHRGVLFAARGGRLRFRMPSGTDACGGAVPEIRSVFTFGRRAADVFSVKGSRRIERGSLRIRASLGAKIDTVRLIGTGRPDWMTVGIFDTSSFVDFFDWDRVGGGFLRHVNRVRLIGRGGEDLLSGNPPGSTVGFSDAARMRLALVGGRGSDRAIGGRRNDHLIGQAGSDKLRGRRGDDILRGGSGQDDCQGGAGNDTVTGC